MKFRKEKYLFKYLKVFACGEELLQAPGCASVQVVHESGHLTLERLNVFVCIRQSIGGRSREGIFSSAHLLVRLHGESCIQFWAVQQKRDMDILERV